MGPPPAHNTVLVVLVTVPFLLTYEMFSRKFGMIGILIRVPENLLAVFVAPCDPGAKN